MGKGGGTKFPCCKSALGCAYGLPGFTKLEDGGGLVKLADGGGLVKLEEGGGFVKLEDGGGLKSYPGAANGLPISAAGKGAACWGGAAL